MRQAIIRLVGVTDLLSATSSSSYTVDMVKLAAGMTSSKAQTEYVLPNDQVVGSFCVPHGRETNFSSLIFNVRNSNYLGMWHVWRERGCAQSFGGGNLREMNHWEDQNVDGRMILRWILKREGVVGTGWSWLRIGAGGGRL